MALIDTIQVKDGLIGEGQLSHDLRGWMDSIELRVTECENRVDALERSRGAQLRHATTVDCDKVFNQGFAKGWNSRR